MELRSGIARELDLPDASVDVAALNGLYNIFEAAELGFGAVEPRARRRDRVLYPARHGAEEGWGDGKGHLLVRDQPLPVCDKTFAALALTPTRLSEYPGGIIHSAAPPRGRR